MLYDNSVFAIDYITENYDIKGIKKRFFSVLFFELLHFLTLIQYI